MRFPAIVMLIMLLAAPAVAAEDDEMRAVRAMIALDKTCIEAGGQPQALKKLVAPKEDFALPPLSGKRAEVFLAGRAGSVWHLPPQLGEAALAMTDDGTCSVFLGEIDPDALLGVAEAWWEKHPTYRIEPAGQTESAYVSRHYKLTPRKGKQAPPLKFVVALTERAETPYQAALSVSR